MNEIVELVGIDQSGVSRHLRLLAEGGFVKMRVDGPRRLYTLRSEPFREVATWLNGYRSVWERRKTR